MRLIIVMMLASIQIQAATYEIKSTLGYFPDVVKVTNCVLLDKGFQDELKSIKSFTDSKHNGEQVLATLLKEDKKVVIRTYKKRLTSAIAYRSENEVYFNTMKNPRPLGEMVATLSHETSHVYGYGHSFKYNSKRPFSVPYMIGTIAEKHYQNCFMSIQNDKK